MCKECEVPLHGKMGTRLVDMQEDRVDGNGKGFYMERTYSTGNGCSVRNVPLKESNSLNCERSKFVFYNIRNPRTDFCQAS